MSQNVKTIKTRIQNKYDVEKNWDQATFTPLKGEVIYYGPDKDADGNVIHDYTRYKVGDGRTPINDLELTDTQNDWNQNDNTKCNFIKNKPTLGGLSSKDSVSADELSAELKSNIETSATHSSINNGNPHGITKQMLGVVETYNNEEPLLNNVGGILATNHKDGFQNVPITDLITELLYPYTAPVINSFSLSPAAGAKEMNVDLTVNTATVKVTKKSKSIESVSLYKGSTLIETKTDAITSSGTTLTFNINETLDGSTDTSYQVKVVEANGATINSSNQTYDFVYPYFYGVVSGVEDISSDTITGFTKGIRAKGNHSYTYTTDNQCPVIAYPASYNNLKSIIDPNNFKQDWTKLTVTVSSDTIPNVSYNVYVGGKASLTAAYAFSY